MQAGGPPEPEAKVRERRPLGAVVSPLGLDFPHLCSEPVSLGITGRGH